LINHLVDIVIDSHLPLIADQARWISQHQMQEHFPSLLKTLEANASVVGRNEGII
jgi:hypothetical protein